jgi:hypothetical protein
VYFSYDAIERTALEREPFAHVIIPNCVSAESLKNIGANFLPVLGPGSHPPSELNIRGHFAALLDELHSATFAVEEKFGIDLSQRPTMCTVRGYVQKKDGGIHTTARPKSSPSSSIAMKVGITMEAVFDCCGTAPILTSTLPRFRRPTGQFSCSGGPTIHARAPSV